MLTLGLPAHLQLCVSSGHFVHLFHFVNALNENEILLQSIGPTLPPSFIKVRSIVTEIYAVNAGQTDR